MPSRILTTLPSAPRLPPDNRRLRFDSLKGDRHATMFDRLRDETRFYPGPGKDSPHVTTVIEHRPRRLTRSNISIKGDRRWMRAAARNNRQTSHPQYTEQHNRRPIDFRG